MCEQKYFMRKSYYKISYISMTCSLPVLSRVWLWCITLRVTKGKKAYYKKIADAAGISLNQYIVNAMDEKIDRER